MLIWMEVGRPGGLKISGKKLDEWISGKIDTYCDRDFFHKIKVPPLDLDFISWSSGS